METCFQFHRQRTRTEHEPNFVEVPEPEQNQTLITKELKQSMNQKF